jgi:glycosyltransferase involved in cell wall biosynthesis
MRVSVLCPTFGRPERHGQLLRVFLEQDYPDADLWVLDDSPERSPSLTRCRNERVHYLHSAGRMPVGAKRNWLLACSRGEIVAHFDDDDWYAPDYLSTMVGELQREKLDFLKLSVWNALSELDGSFWQCDTRVIQANHFILSSDKPAVERSLTDAQMASLPEDDHDGNLWGYGFSYVYRRWVGERWPFLAVDFGEDYEFVKRVRVGAHIGHLPGNADKVVHVMHPKNTAPRIFPQKRLDASLIPSALRPTAPGEIDAERHARAG